MMIGGGSSATFDINGNMTEAGVMALVAHTNFQTNATMNLHAETGYALAAAEMPTYLDDECCVEINAVMSYKLLDNLTHDLLIGYLMTGDFFNGASATAEVEDIILATHHMTMEF